MALLLFRFSSRFSLLFFFHLPPLSLSWEEQVIQHKLVEALPYVRGLSLARIVVVCNDVTLVCNRRYHIS